MVAITTMAGLFRQSLLQLGHLTQGWVDFQAAGEAQGTLMLTSGL